MKICSDCKWCDSCIMSPPDGRWSACERFEDKSVKWDAIQPLEVSQEAIEQCILLLQKAGWMQEHDRILTEGKTATWEPISKMGEVVRCSNCKKYWTWAFNTYEVNYCPNCGARMDGEE